jgi:hypothetical protein
LANVAVGKRIWQGLAVAVLLRHRKKEYRQLSVNGFFVKRSVTESEWRVSKPTLYWTQQILKNAMRFIGAVMAGLTTGMCVLLASALFRATPAFATSVPPPPAPASVSVLPLFDAPSKPRKIVVSGSWADSCGPIGVSLDSSDTSQTGILVIRATFNPVGPICAQVAANYRFELDYTPKDESVYRVVVTSAEGQLRGEGYVITTADAKVRSAVDVSGVWFDPATNGSGLTFRQRFRFDDATFGTWYLYDQAGAPRWYSIQNVVWNADGRSFEGQLLETRSPAGACPQPGTPCPVASTVVNRTGTVKMTLTGDEFAADNSLRMKLEAFSPAVSSNNTPLFSSNVRKIAF